jgi:hypothetical protein
MEVVVNHKINQLVPSLMRSTLAYSELIVRDAAPSISPEAGVTVMAFVAALPVESLMTTRRPDTTAGSVRDLGALVLTKFSEDAVRVTFELMVARVRALAYPLPSTVFKSLRQFVDDPESVF